MGKSLKGFLFHHHSCVVQLGGGNKGVFIKEIKEEVNEGFQYGKPFVVLVCWEQGMWIFNVKLTYIFIYFLILILIFFFFCDV